MTYTNTPLRLNFPSEDYLTNESILVWNFLGKKPFKKGYSGLFSLEPVEEILSSFNPIVISDEKFFDTIEEENHVKRVVRLDESLVLGYQYLEKKDQETILPIFTFYYLDRSEESIEDLCKKILKSSGSTEDDTEKLEKRTCFLSLSPATGLTLEDVTIPKVDWKNIWKFYSSSVESESRNLLSFISEKKQTVSLIVGKSGSGKTTLVRSLSEKIDRDIIYLSPVTIDLSISSPEFPSFCNTLNPSLIILDGLDFIFDSPHKNPSHLLSTIQNLTSGFFKDILDIHFVLVLENPSYIRDIEKHLPAHFTLKIEDLEPKRATSLAKYLDKNEKFTQPTPLSTIVRGKVYEKSMGF